MSTSKTLLLHVLADVLRSEAGQPLPDYGSLMKDFRDDCEAVLARYEIGEAGRSVLMTMDRQILGEWMRQEVLDAPTKLWSTPRAGYGASCSSTGRLLFLVADLVRSEVQVARPKLPDLAHELEAHPDSVMDAYGLDAGARQALGSLDREIVAEYLFQDFLRTPASPPGDLWTDPVPQISSVAPTTLEAGPGQTLQIVADCVLSTTEVHLVSDDGFNHVVAKAVMNAPVTLTDQVLSATFDLTGALPDDYRVLLYLSRVTPPIEHSKFIKVVAPSV